MDMQPLGKFVHVVIIIGAVFLIACGIAIGWLIWGWAL
jgi:hypothetical protein